MSDPHMPSRSFLPWQAEGVAVEHEKQLEDEICAHLGFKFTKQIDLCQFNRPTR